MKEALAGAEGVGGIDDDEVVFVLPGADEAQPVLKVDVQPRVVQPAGGLRQVLFAHVHHQRVDLHHVDVFDGVIAGQLPDHAAVARADDQDVPGGGCTAIGTWVIISW